MKFHRLVTSRKCLSNNNECVYREGILSRTIAIKAFLSYMVHSYQVLEVHKEELEYILKGVGLHIVHTAFLLDSSMHMEEDHPYCAH